MLNSGLLKLHKRSSLPETVVLLQQCDSAKFDSTRDANGLLHSSQWCETDSVCTCMCVCFGSHTGSISVQESVVVYSEVRLCVSSPI